MPASPPATVRRFAIALADDVTMIVTGQYSWSQTFHGKEAVLRDLFGYVRSLLKDNSRTVPFRFIADDEWVVVEARGEMDDHQGGARYDNYYCLLYCIDGGRIQRDQGILRFDACERVLGPFPQEKKRAADIAVVRRFAGRGIAKRDDSGCTIALSSL